jgi:cytochrome c oxidase subunit II
MKLFKKIFQLFVFCGFVLCALPAFADHQWNMSAGVTPISHEVYRLHMIAFWICVVIGIVVFGVMFYALIMHRKSRHPVPAQFNQHLLLEIAWAVVPLLILVAVAIPATIVLFRMDDTRNADIVIKITGYQWKWRYEYLNQGISFFSNLSTPMNQRFNLEPKGPHYLLEVDKPLVVPVGEKIRFLVTANDVIHSWWVPDFGIKQDAIPGFIHEAWAEIDKPGTYRGQCAELCGAGHGFMPIVVVALPKPAFNAWVRTMTAGKVNAVNMLPNKRWTKSELLQKGRQVYAAHCAACHQPSGQGLPPLYPALQNNKMVLGAVDDSIKMLLQGVSGTAMQSFADQLTDEEIAAVATYIRNSFGNNAADIAQPNEVGEMRKLLNIKENN